MKELTKQDFEILNEKILHCGNMAKSYVLEMAKLLKEMRDKKLFLQGGFETFGEYSEEELGLKERHAYNFIKSIEELGEEVLLNRGNLGITKLVLIAAADSEDREELLDEADNLSVKALKERIAQLETLWEEKNKQLGFLEEENERLKSSAESTELEDSLKEKDQEIERLLSLLDEEKTAQVTVTDDETRLKMEKSEHEKAKLVAKLEKITKEKDNLVAAEKQRLDEEIKAKEKAFEEKLQNEVKLAKEKVEQEIEVLKKEAQTKQLSEQVASFKAKFGVCKNLISELISDTEKMTEDDSVKCKKALEKLLEVSRENL